MKEKETMERARWIWCNDTPAADEYGEFYADFVWQGGKALLSISADSDYAVYVNGTLCTFGQYHDYPYDKVYDTLDIAPYCSMGRNRLAIVVWYYGDGNMSYYPGTAGLLFQLNGENGVLCASGPCTQARMSTTYQNHRRKQITSQLGFGFAYDATREDGWMREEGAGFAPAHPVPQDLPLRPRPCEKLTLEEPRAGALIKQFEDGAALYDLEQNTVGFLHLCVTSPVEQTLLISYGEHMADGRVRRLIGKRDFSVEVRVRQGETVYLNPFRRLGCRYLEVSAEAPLTACRVAVLPTAYPLRERPAPADLSPAERRIYDICVNTLRLCMHEHYEDCPWREQALYCMDSRNQMLCGYYAFGETRFPRANLELIAGDDRPDGLLSICYPSREPLAIPSFSLHYFTECAEYLHYSGDTDFLRSIYPKLQSVLRVFLQRCDNGNSLIAPFPDAQHWNFYEWRRGLDGSKSIDRTVPDLPLNALLSLALRHMADISDALDISHDYGAIADRLNGQIANHFFDNEKQLCFDRDLPTKSYSALGNALAVLCGALCGENAVTVCEKLTLDQTLTPISISMQCFVYDALLKTNFAKFRPYVLEKIEQTYRPMVDLGLGTVWETERGESDFQNAGSLCHGWSAMPIYYYHILIDNEGRAASRTLRQLREHRGLAIEPLLLTRHRALYQKLLQVNEEKWKLPVHVSQYSIIFGEDPTKGFSLYIKRTPHVYLKTPGQKLHFTEKNEALVFTAIENYSKSPPPSLPFLHLAEGTAKMAEQLQAADTEAIARFKTSGEALAAHYRAMLAMLFEESKFSRYTKILRQHLSSDTVTLADIAENYGVSRERIRQICHSAVKRLPRTFYLLYSSGNAEFCAHVTALLDIFQKMDGQHAPFLFFGTSALNKRERELLIDLAFDHRSGQALRDACKVFSQKRPTQKKPQNDLLSKICYPAPERCCDVTGIRPCTAQKAFKYLQRSAAMLQARLQPLAIIKEPDLIYYSTARTDHRPDFLLRLPDGKAVLVLVADIRRMALTYYVKRFNALHLFCKERGFGYLILDCNHHSIYDIKAGTVAPETVAALNGRLEEQGVLLTEDICRIRESYPLSTGDLTAYVLQNKLYCTDIPYFQIKRT